MRIIDDHDYNGDYVDYADHPAYNYSDDGDDSEEYECCDDDGDMNHFDTDWLDEIFN